MSPRMASIPEQGVSAPEVIDPDDHAASPLPDPVAEGPKLDLIDGGSMLLVGFPDQPSDRQIAEATWAPRGLVIERTSSLSEAREYLLRHSVRLLALGCDLEPPDVVDFLEGLAQEHLYTQPATLLFVECDPSFVQRWVQDDRLFYAHPGPLGEEQVTELLAAGFAHAGDQLMLALTTGGRSQDPRVLHTRKVLTLGEALAGVSELEGLEEPLLEALADVLEVDGGRLWVYDRFEQTLRAAGVEGLEVSAVCGLTSFGARTGRIVSIDHASSDGRFDFEADDGAEGRLMAVPVLGPEQRVLGVLAVWRGVEKARWRAEEQRLVMRFVEHLAPHLLVHAPNPFATHQRRAQQSRGPDFFRAEALDANERNFTDSGRLLKNDPGWARWTWGLVLAGFVGAFVLGLVGSVHEYASGPAIVRIGQRIDVASQVDASVVAVDAIPGAQVAAGDALARLHGATEAAEIANLEGELEQLLRRRLAAPGDTATEMSLVETRTALERARDRLAQRIVRSPTAGVVGDVRVRPGQHLSAGELLLSVIADEEKRSVLGLIPGHFGPQLTVGQRLRLSLVGYPDLSFHLDVVAVGEEVIGPQEARQALGGSIADAPPVGGPVVLVEGRLETDSFSDGEREWLFRDGMQGSMEIRVRSRPILLQLVPGLERAFRRWDEPANP